MLEHQIVPYEATDPTGKRVLVLAPHPDDETLGCGGTLALHSMAGDPVKVVFLTDGSKGDTSGRSSRDEYVLIRKKEAEDACTILGIKDLEFWEYEDRRLSETSGVVQRICDLLQAYKPELIYLPSPIEYHPDHRATAMLLREALKSTGFHCTVAFCEIGSPVGVNCLVDITNTAEKKITAVKCYASQLKERPYLEIILGLNRFRTLTLPEKVSHAEGFSLWSSETIRQSDPLTLVGPKVEKLSISISEVGPLVSIIVRTKDRPEALSNALASITRQTYSNIEVVLVNDGGEDVEDLASQILGDIPLIYVRHKTTRGRGAAANSGLAAFNGEFFTFLDDDDVFYPEHIEVLLRKLLSLGYKVAYSGVKNVFYEGPPSRPGKSTMSEVLFNRKFDKELLLFENYIPLMSLLFSREVINEVGGICEDLDLFEDWDFLVRVSRRYDFLHVDKVTAEYRFYGARTTEEAHEDKYVYEEAHAKVFERFLPFMTGKAWSRYLTVGYVAQLKSVVKNLQDELSVLSRELKDLRAENSHLQELVEVRSQELEDLRAEKSNLETWANRVKRHPAYKAYRLFKKVVS